MGLELESDIGLGAPASVRGELLGGLDRIRRGLRLFLGHSEITILVAVELEPERLEPLSDESHQCVLIATTLTGSVTKDGVAGAGA